MKHKGKILLKATLKINGNFAKTWRFILMAIPSLTGLKSFTASLTQSDHANLSNKKKDLNF